MTARSVLFERSDFHRMIDAMEAAAGEYAAAHPAAARDVVLEVRVRLRESTAELERADLKEPR